MSEEPLTPIPGWAEGMLYPDDIAFFTDEERELWRAEIAARQARRRQPGFTASWPDPPAELRRLA